MPFTLKPIYVGHIWFHSKVNLIKVANLRDPLDPVKTELCTVHSSECRDSCSSWRAGAWPCQWLVTCNQLPLEYSIFPPILVQKRWRFVKWTAGIYANEWRFLPMYSMVQKPYNFMSTSILGLNWYRKHNTVRKLIGKVKDKQVAKMWSNKNV